MALHIVPSFSGRARQAEPVTIHLSGELDMMTAPDLRERLRRVLVEHRGALIVVDLSAVSFMDCSGLRPLLEARAVLGNRLMLQRVPPQVLRLLAASGTTGTLLR